MIFWILDLKAKLSPECQSNVVEGGGVFACSSV
jgi:hypothetical protein